MTDDRFLARILDALDPPPSHKGATAAAIRTAAIPRWASDLRTVRGTCRGGTKRNPCRSRWGVVRITFDYRDRAAVSSFAHIECVTCGRVWRRVRVPRLGEYQSTLLTLILPAHAKRWFARGTWHRQGADAIVRDAATWGDLMEAARDWRERNATLTAARHRAAERKAAENAEASARMARLLETLHAQDAERAAEEAAAAAREGVA